MDLRHRQFNPLFILERSLRFLREAPKTLKRRTTGVAEDIWLKSHLYPDYYMNSWHYQTDGWLSSESAGVYETNSAGSVKGSSNAEKRNRPEDELTVTDEWTVSGLVRAELHQRGADEAVMSDDASSKPSSNAESP